jgi:hypothetical protein
MFERDALGYERAATRRSPARWRGVAGLFVYSVADLDAGRGFEPLTFRL